MRIQLSRPIPPARRIAGLVVVALALAGCNLDLSGIGTPGAVVRGSGITLEEVRDLRNFTGIVLDAPGVVQVTIGESESVVLEAEDNLLRYLRTTVESGRLRIVVDSQARLQPTVPIRYRVTMRELSRVTAAGEGRIEASGVRGDRLLVSSGGSGGIRLDDVRVNRLSVAVTGSGAVRAVGRVPLFDASLGASGPIEGRDLDVDEAEVSIAGSGSATLRVRRRLDANLSGSGSMLYYGSPTVYQSVTGAGEVRRLGS
jgi:hypothetical protein